MASGGVRLKVTVVRLSLIDGGVYAAVGISSKLWARAAPCFRGHLLF